MIILSSETALDKVALALIVLVFQCRCSVNTIFLFFPNVSGEFGIVYKAMLDGWKSDEVEQVAVKTLKGEEIASFF